jgi:hypothetical protein
MSHHRQLGDLQHVCGNLVSSIPSRLDQYVELILSNYIADAYEVYSSSAQAAQSFCRNMASATFPLFAHQMVSVALSHPSGTDEPVQRHGIPAGDYPRRLGRSCPRGRSSSAPAVWQTPAGAE